jgi:hypothetical protein
MKSSKLSGIMKVVNTLAKFPDGLWLRKLARESKTTLGTLERYLSNDLKDLIDNVGPVDEKGRYFGLRLIKLKPQILQLVQEGKSEKIETFIKG